MTPEKDKVAVFICRCGGNISDYVDVEKVAKAIGEEPEVAVSQIHTFTCSEAAQKEMVETLKQKGLKRIVIASCSPKLHLETFRNMLRGANFNEYLYVHVNIREQCAWAHKRDKQGATEKAIALIKGGVAKALRARELYPIKVPVKSSVVIIGAGLSGLHAADALSDLGIEVNLFEKEERPGGLYGRIENLLGEGIVNKLWNRVSQKKNVKFYSQAKILSKEGGLGQFKIRFKSKEKEGELEVGAIILATGLKPYQPGLGEFGYDGKKVITLLEFLELLKREKDLSAKEVAFIYCVGVREKTPPRTYCARFCCPAALKISLLAFEKGIDSQYHLVRDVRSYGFYERIYREVREKGALFFRYEADSPPSVEVQNGRPLVRVKDIYTEGKEIEINPDLVVLITGALPGIDEELLEVLKISTGKEGFLAEVHPKLRPVETFVEGIYLAGSSSGPRTAEESVITGLSAAAKASSVLLKGEIEKDPRIAEVILDKCNGCGECIAACPFEAIEKTDDGKVKIKEHLCKGEGACVAVCSQEAIQLKGFEHETIYAVIKAMASGGKGEVA